MANIFFGLGAPGTVGFSTASATRYVNLGQSFLNYYSAEATAQIKCRSAGTASNLRAYVSTNGRGTATTVTYRDNTADGNQTFSIGAGVTGIIEDTTHTDTLSDADLMAAKIITGTGTGAITIDFLDMRVAVTSGSAVQTSAGNTISTATASTTTYMNICGLLDATTTEAFHGQAAPVNLTLSNFQVYIVGNSRGTTTTFGSRVNAGAGNQSVSVTAGATGLFEDTTNSDSVTAGQLFNARRTTGTGTGTISNDIPGFKVVTDGAGFPLFAQGLISNAATFYTSVMGYSVDTTTENTIEYPIPFACTGAKLVVNVSANTSVTDTLVKSRINGADGNQVVTITALTTGVFQDTTHSDSFDALDELTYSISGHTVGAPTIRTISMFLTETISAGVGKLYLGSTQIKQLYLGATQIKKAYLGTGLVYSD